MIYTCSISETLSRLTCSLEATNALSFYENDWWGVVLPSMNNVRNYA